MNVAIIVAAGQGRRMGGGLAKQFLELAGIPIIIHTVRLFDRCDAIHEVIVVLPAEDVSAFLSLAGADSLQKVKQVVSGGATRAESVWRGLSVVPVESAA